MIKALCFFFILSTAVDFSPYLLKTHTSVQNSCMFYISTKSSRNHSQIKYTYLRGEISWCLFNTRLHWSKIGLTYIYTRSSLRNVTFYRWLYSTRLDIHNLWRKRHSSDLVCNHGNTFRTGNSTSSRIFCFQHHLQMQ